MPICTPSASRRLRWLLGDLAWAPMFRLPRPVPNVPGWIPGDSHVHTDASDGMVPLELQVAWAAANGHGWIAITDHGDGVDTDFGSYFRRCAAAGEEHGIAVMPGVELSAVHEDDRSRKDGDVVVYGLGPKARVPANMAFDGAELLRHAGKSASPAFRIIAHPTAALRQFRWSRWEHTLIEGIELVTGSARADPRTLRRWFELGRAALAGHQRWHTGVGGSDAHAPWQTPGLGGLTWVRAEKDATPEDVRRSLAAGRAVVSTHGDFACINVGDAAAGDTVVSADEVGVTLTVRPARLRTCVSATIYDENAHVVALRIGPCDGDELRVPTTSTRALIAHFEFCSAGMRARGEVWTNPIALTAAQPMIERRDPRRRPWARPVADEEELQECV